VGESGHKTIPSGRYSGRVTKAETTRARILSAAEEVVLRDGVAHLTLEAAAAEAGMSKGGVLYHFPSRDALVQAMLARLTASFDEQLARAGARTPESSEPGTFTLAYLRATVAAPADEQSQREERLGAALIAALAADPVLLEPLREEFQHWQARCLTDGIDPALATLVRIVADGLWLTGLFRLGAVEGELLEQVVGLCTELVERAVAGRKVAPTGSGGQPRRPCGGPAEER